MNLVWLWWLGCGAQQPEVVVREGVESLARHVGVPPALHEVRWAGRPLGTVGLGPTDLELVAWFPVAEGDRAAVEAALGAPLGEDVRRVPGALAGVLPPELAAARSGDEVVLRGVVWPATAFENAQWKGGFALWVAGGLVVQLYSF
ncbi:MAG: hypothetical protein ABMA64_28235 [Myxococcota bacterium]